MFAELLLRQRQAVGDHSPGVSALLERHAYVRKVFAHERLSAGNDNEHLVRIDVGCDFRIYDAQKILRRHIGRFDRSDAVTAAMEAMDIAA